MDKRIKYWVLVLVLIGIIMLEVMANIISTNPTTEEEMMTKMNTPENIQLISKALDNPELLSSIPFFNIFKRLQTDIQNKNQFVVKVNNTRYHFIKYIGLFNCDSENDKYGDCSNLASITVKNEYVKFVYFHEDELRQFIPNKLN